ncbi:MAG: NAD(P)-binding domain-containing protein [Myxococcales bacterium]|nr:NAD(P)-binding domain-containing protein [Deltaproteobacteria bacterium]NND29785.1 NAD(P)-binding domain-containing protein [Myxococcales bacterium]
MRFLIIGAGNIGSLYAAKLAQSSQEVTVLARGARLEEIRQRGIELEHAVSGERTRTPVQVVDHLDSADEYDVVLVILPKQRIAEVLPVLAANQRTPSVMFFGNNAAGPGAMTDAIGQGRVLLGFPGAAGVPHEGAIRYVITSAREQPTTLGELDGSRSARILGLASALEASGFPVSVSTNIDAWLKTHVAKILPTVCTLFQAGGTPEQLADDDEALRLMLRAIREGFRVLRANGVPITPRNHRVLDWLPESALLFLMRKMVSAETAAIKFGHAEQGRAEWVLLADEFRQLIEQAGIPTPSLDAAYRQLSPA